MKTALAFLVAIGVIGIGVTFYAKYISAQPAASFRTATVVRGDLVATISATGTVEPEEVVDVGAQVAGRIKNLGIDPTDAKKTIDYGSVVHEGTVLANIDDAVYSAQVDQAKASLLRAQADLLQYQAKLLQAKQEYERAESLRPTKAIADTDYDLALANFQAAKANVAVGEAVIGQAEAALRLAKTNLNYTVIISPVEGVIIDRRVNIGQTVVASLNAPSLFLIAKDLRRMQVWASVNEADIGRIHEGMPVRFTVDAYPGETFVGTVTQLRLNATMTQNVVTYTVVVTTDNSNGKLKPYLTANLQFEIEHRSNVLTIPNAAMRWKPRPAQVTPSARESLAAASKGRGKGGKSRPSGGASADAAKSQKTAGADAAPAAKPAAADPTAVADKTAPTGKSPRVGKTEGTGKKAAAAEKPAGAEKAVGKNKAAGAEKSAVAGEPGTADKAGKTAAESKSPGAAKDRAEQGRLWVQTEDDEYVRPVNVQFGATDGSSTEVSGSDVKEGMEVVIGESRNEQVDDSSTNNPFAPKFFRGSRKKSD